MKNLAALSVVALALTPRLLAGPLPKAEVSADAKWLVHVDADKFRSTRIGAYFIKEVLERKLADPRQHLKSEFDFDLDVNRISSLTAYGTDYRSKPDRDGVLIIRTDLELKKGVENAMRKQSQGSDEDSGMVKRLSGGSNPLYSVHNDLFVSIHPGKLVLLGKSREAVEHADAVLSGKSANLGSGKAFTGFPDVPKAFFFVAIAEGFNEDAPLPPQAKVLQLTDGGRLVLGENADKLFASLSLKAKSSQVVTQMQQVIQGTVALASLSKPENPELMQLAQSVKLTTDDNIVTVGIEYPVDKVIQKINEKNRD
jgi:hypothetical protein